MITLDFNKPIHVHFIGIGGISMSGLADILLSRGFTVSGSDMNTSDLTKGLEKKGAKIFEGHSADNITDEINLVVYTAAIKEDNPEMVRAAELKIPLMKRAELLGELMDNYKYSVAVCGTHGKTTTTSMIAQCLMEEELDPTITVGGLLDAIGGNLRIGESEIFLSEACEYMNSFLSMNPYIGVILNIEADHLDFFKDINDIRNSFKKFASNVNRDGLIVINKGIDNYEEIVKDASASVITFGLDNSADFWPKNLKFDSWSRGDFTVCHKEEELFEIRLGASGEHNVLNALAVFAVAQKLGLDFQAVGRALSAFHGAHRRFERRGEIKGISVFDDYAHHPTEIRATLKTAKSCPHNELWVIFQPHTYTRTAALFDDFVKELSVADHVILADIFAAREKNTIGISSEDLCKALKEKGVDAYYFSDFQEIKDFALNKCKKNDMLITMGAGNVVNIANDIFK